ncbi:MAG: serine/threonine protein kinase [Clostridia bacterium]|nr:serine/threonine protein kinase [Clostridia bacterium]
MIRCLRCFEEYPDIFGVCPVCGNSVGCLSADSERLKPGCLLHGRYIVGYGVGRGGFGSVYRGYDKLTGTVTAIKELFVPSLVERSRDGITVGLRSSRFAPAWKAGIRRFFGEAEAEMSAPASVGCAVYDCFEENGTAYLVMEYLGGLSLAGIISSGGCGLPEKIDLIVKTALAVSALHCSGRVHLDIAPDNVMAVGDGHSREIRLIDFGSSGEGHRLPFTAERVFKEGYSSPELVFGKDPSDDPESGVKSDVYSLGATAYMLLTGKRPPAAGDREGARLIPPHEVDAAVPAAVSLAVVKAMSCDPGRRFQSAAEFARAVSAGACLAPVTGKEIKRGKKKSGQGVALTRQAYAAVGEKSPDPLRFFREVRDMPPADFPVCDMSFSAGVSEPLPERLLPGTTVGGRYETGLGCRREGACLVYRLEGRGIFSEFELCEFYPSGSCRRAADGRQVEETDFSYCDLLDGFFRSVSEFSLLRDEPGGEGFTDAFYENGTAYALRRAGRRLIPAELRQKKGRVSDKRCARILRLIEPIFRYASALSDSGLDHMNITHRSVRMKPDGSLGLFSPLRIFYPKGGAVLGEYRPPELVPSTDTPFLKSFPGPRRREGPSDADLYMLAVLFCRLAGGTSVPTAEMRKERLTADLPDPLLEAVERRFSTGIAAGITAAVKLNPVVRREDLFK